MIRSPATPARRRLCLKASRLAGAAVFVVVAAGLTGCGQRYPVVPVSGQVTFAGGPPPAAGTIDFLPLADDGLRRPGVGAFDARGTLTVTSFREGDGLLPGTYRLEMRCVSNRPSGEPADGDPHQATTTVDHVPEGFSPAELVVPARGRVFCRVDVPAGAGSR